MLTPQSMNSLGQGIREQILSDRAVLDELREEIRLLSEKTRRVQPRSTTAISLVGTDGGNNRLEFDPFMVQVVRVVDSSNNEYCLDVVTPTTDVQVLGQRQFNGDGTPRTPLGRMMRYMGVRNLWELSTMIPRPRAEGEPNTAPKPSWVQVYREIVEWAILFELVREKNFGTDTLIMRDGFLRSKVFAADLFVLYRRGIGEGIDRQFRNSCRRIYLAGLAKHSQVLQRYRLAMAIEGIMQQSYPCFVEIPRDLEEKAYRWSEYARGDEREEAGGEINKFVAGKMFFVKFGGRPRDPIWPIDLFQSQANDAQSILGYILADAINGFPVPFYPQCLQRAHQNAALVDFDMDILQAKIFAGIRESLGNDAPVLDTFRLADGDPSGRRYQ